jgi:hypothetical protein
MRQSLVERLQLDLDLIRGLRLLFLCALMFGLVIYAGNLERRSEERLADPLKSHSLSMFTAGSPYRAYF